MTRYKLPDCLGGAIVEGEKKWPHGGGIDHELSITVPGLARQITLFESDVTEVKPPIPDAPEPGAYLIGTALVILTRTEDDDRTFVHQPGDRAGIEWSHWWAEYGAARVGLTANDIHRLVPESSDRAQPPTVRLPWTHQDHGGDGVEIGVTGGDRAYIAVVEGGTRACMWLETTIDRSRAIAAIHAADEAIGGEE